MRLLFSNHLQNALQSLSSNRVRSGLTVLGVTIGIASITTILAISGGASRIVNSQVDQLGGNIAVIRPGGATDLITNITQPQPDSSYAVSTLKESDLAVISATPHVKNVAPLMRLSGTIKADAITLKNSTILATTPDLAEIAQLKMHDGQFLDNSIDQNTVVVGKQLSINVFGTDSSIGKTLEIKNQLFVVIGVLGGTNNPINYDSVDFDNAAIINYSSGKALNQNVAQIQQIDVRSDSATDLKSEVNTISVALTKNHSGEADFSIMTGDQISRPNSQMFYTIASIMAAIAAISLIVGGIGIMNIMLVTVAERTHEIGIRKAIGASNSDIMWQFLIESLAMSIGGGITGYLIGYLIAISVGAALNFNPSFNWQIAAFSLLISFVMGTIFGLYPAIRAARRDPIESLNQRS